MTDMSSETTINSEFVRNWLNAACDRRRMNGTTWPAPPCRGADRYCGLADSVENLGWGECVECIGDCYIGIGFINDWIRPISKTRLKSCLKSSTAIDWLLHLSKKRYRDHSSHQLFVGILGAFLLDCEMQLPSSNGTFGSTLSLKEWIGGHSGMNDDEIELSWWIASLFHDHAYPLAHMLRIVPTIVEDNRGLLLDQTWSLLGFTSATNRSARMFERLYDFTLLRGLRSIAENSSRDPGTREAQEQYNALIQSQISRYFDTGEFKDCRECCYDHGVLAAANIVSLLGRSEPNQVLKHAVRAIGIHNGMICSESVNIGSDPIAFLLILCDELQEWDRRIIADNKVISESDHIRFGNVENTDGKFYIKNNRLNITFEYPNARWLSETGWDYRMFRHSKEKALSRLRVPDDFPISHVEFSVEIPHSHEFVKEEMA